MSEFNKNRYEIDVKYQIMSLDDAGCEGWQSIINLVDVGLVRIYVNNIFTFFEEKQRPLLIFLFELESFSTPTDGNFIIFFLGAFKLSSSVHLIFF